MEPPDLDLPRLGGPLLALAALLGAFGARAAAGEPAGYHRPSPEVAALAELPPPPAWEVDPRRQWVLRLERPGLLPLEAVALEERRVAGLPFFPANLARATGLRFTGLVLTRLTDGAQVRVRGLPEAPWLQDVRASPDGRHVAFTHAAPSRLEPWVLEAGTGLARPLGPVALHGVMGPACTWLGDGTGLVCRRAVPRPPPRDGLSGPYVQQHPRREPAPEAAGGEAVQDLTSQLVRLGLDGSVSSVGTPGPWVRAESSPDGAYLLVEALRPPWPSSASATRIPRRLEVWTTRGEPVRTLAAPGMREVGWRADAPATLVWAEASPREEEERLRVLAAPFQKEPALLAALPGRFGTLHWEGRQLALVRGTRAGDGREQHWTLDPSRLPAVPHPLALGPEDTPLPRGGPSGPRRARGGRTLLITGQTASPEGPRAWLDAVDGRTGARERLWQAAGPFHEVPLALLDADGRQVLTRRESREAPPDLYVHTPGAGAPRRLTTTPVPSGLVTGRSEVMRYRRADGLELSALLHLPPGWRPDQGRLPVLLWAYPEESSAGEPDTLHRFPAFEPLSPRAWALRGYAVLDGPLMPVVARDGRPPNDTYVEQLVANARAAVGALVERGVADPERIAVGGHSYGAAMVALLLAHTDLFRAGIAVSGAYNRTLTPFGFQGERRTLWEAPQVYQQASPLLVADRIRAPLLLLHGQRDGHPATPFFQSEALYRALERQGAPARLVGLPGEGHVLRARPSVLHALWEMEQWLEQHVKQAPPRPR